MICRYCNLNETDTNVYLYFEKEKSTLRRPICFSCKQNKAHLKELEN